MNRWKIATVALAVVAATGWTMTPASSHVAGWAHNWSAHIKPRADMRYYTKAASNARYGPKSVKPGQKASGIWAVAGGASQYASTTLNFPVPMSGQATAVWGPNDTTNCPGVGQAAAGYLCVYPSWTNAMNFNTFLDTGLGSTVTPYGTAIVFNATADSGNARGSWTLSPAPATARVPATPRPKAPALGR